MKKFYGLLIFNMVFVLMLTAQTAPLADWQRLEMQNRNTDKNVMYVLGSWAILNMAYSGFSLSGAEGTTKSYHRMNIGWNAVNAGLAGLALLRSTPMPSTISQIVENHYGSQKIFLLNTGLDVAYMVGGVYLMERSKNSVDKADQFKGFGQAVLVNGAFLFALDVTAYFIHNGQNKTLQPLLEGGKIGLLLHF